MQSIGFWQILIVVVCLILPTLVPVWLASPDKTMGRKTYLILSLCYFVFMIALGAALEEFQQTGMTIVGGVIALVASVLFVLWSVHRAQAAGLTKWWCVIFALPLVNFLYWIFLAVRTDRKKADNT